MRRCDPDPARLDSSGLALKGSMLQIQLYVNRLSDRLDGALVESLPGLARWDRGIEWVSPIESDGFREYADSEFISALRLGRTEAQALKKFWPRRGPCWDALGVGTETGRGCLIVEAKSYPREAVTSTGATGDSLAKIKNALSATAAWLGVPGLPDSWLEIYYQTANRLAHLYLLREVCGLDAHLAFVCFVEDPLHQPTTEMEWLKAFQNMMDSMAIPELPTDAAFVLLPGVTRSRH